MGCRVVYLTIGSEGDIRPGVALSLGLRRAGYDACVATHRHFEPLVRSHGVDFAPLAGDPQEFLESEGVRDWDESPQTPFQQLREMTAAIRPAIRQGLRDHWDACRNADVILYHGLSRYPAQLISNARGVPAYPAHVLLYHSVSGYPRMTDYAIPLLRRTMNRAFNEHYQWIGELVTWQFVRRFVNEWRREFLCQTPLGLFGPTRDLWRARPWLYGLSEHLVPRGPRWPNDVHLTGFWLLDGPPGWNPPADLVAFLDAGSPPVYIGFGSMVISDRAAELDLILEAIQRSGRRAVVSAFGSGNGRESPSTFFLRAPVPHEWLFPRVAAVVHHGGCGTLARGLWAGRPTVAVPFFGDQRRWAARVVALGVGPEPIPHAELTAERLAVAVGAAVEDAAMRERAEALGERLRVEDGVARAVEILDRDIRQRLG